MIDKDLYIRVKDEPNFVRDRITGALVNINTRDIELHKKIHEKRLQEQQELSKLKADVAEIKDLLRQLLNK